MVENLGMEAVACGVVEGDVRIVNRCILFFVCFKHVCFLSGPFQTFLITSSGVAFRLKMNAKDQIASLAFYQIIPGSAITVAA